jgi:Flp pilus assembly protein TadG
MVEFMLVVVFLFVLFVSILQMILLMYAYTTLADAAKEGIRYAIVHGTGNTNCSGPGTTGPPAVSCSDTTGANVKARVIDFAGLSFQNVQTSDVTVDYNPNSANGSNPCNVPGCLVRVAVSHKYQPFFGLSWPTIRLNAAADGRIMN